MALKDGEMRWQHANPCAECALRSTYCGNSKRCDPVRQKLRGYDGIRMTADGFDCALPVTIDSHSACSFGCIYCFSDNLMGHRESRRQDVGQTSLKTLENIFSGKPTKKGRAVRKALKYDDRNKRGYPCPVQLGGVTDPCDNIERNQGWLLKFMKLAIKYEQPVRLSTKGVTFLEDEYLDVIAERPELFWVAFSIISPDDELLPKIDKGAPTPSERLEAMRRVKDIGAHASLRFRPLVPNLSDKTPNHDRAWEVLIDRAAEVGADAISYETIFLLGSMTTKMHERFAYMEKMLNVPLRKIYKQFGSHQACIRPSYLWAEEIMHAIRDRAKKHDMWIGVSDPVWKQLTECGCCCGIPRTHPVFGNWERESATNRLMEAKQTGKLLHLDDIVPEWAKDYREDKMVAYPAGPHAQYARRHRTWADALKEVWNDIDKERSPVNYFQGALYPVDTDADGNLVYKYVGLQRQHLHVPYWTVK